MRNADWSVSSVTIGIVYCRLRMRLRYTNDSGDVGTGAVHDYDLGGTLILH